MRRTTRAAGRRLPAQPLIVSAASAIRNRLAGGRHAQERVWDASMTALTLGALFLVMLVSLADAWSVAVVDRSPARLVEGMETITDVALVRWYIFPAAFVVVCLGLMDWNAGSRLRRFYASFVFAHALFVTTAVAAVWFLTRGLKIAFGRARPELFDMVGAYELEILEFQNRYWSFPSGHAATAGAVTTILMLWFPRARALVLLLGMVLATSRVAIEEHYPSDVVAGFCIAMLVTLLLARWLSSRSLLFRRPPGRVMPLARWPRRWRR